MIKAESSVLSGKVVFITGASSGIGLSTTKLLYAHGAHVVLAARRLENLETIKSDLLANLRKYYYY